LMRSTKTPPYR